MTEDSIPEFPAPNPPRAKSVFKKKANGKNATGRPTTYDPKYCQMIIDFFDVPHSETKLISETKSKNGIKQEFKETGCPLPFITGFARLINVNVDTLHEWKKVHKDFSESYARARALQAEMLHSNTLKGLYNANYGIFAAKNITEWRDKVEIDHGLQDPLIEKYKDASAKELLEAARETARLVLVSSGAPGSNPEAPAAEPA